MATRKSYTEARGRTEAEQSGQHCEGPSGLESSYCVQLSPASLGPVCPPTPPPFSAVPPAAQFTAASCQEVNCPGKAAGPGPRAPGETVLLQAAPPSGCQASRGTSHSGILPGMQKTLPPPRRQHHHLYPIPGSCFLSQTASSRRSSALQSC